MRGKSLVSVIVPVYNTESYLKKCINSIINQTWQEIEIFLVNDGSTDRSADICRSYAARDSRITFINKSNGGVASARNAALDRANGKWMVCVDSDDFVEAGYVEDMVMAAESEGAELAVCNYSTERKKGKNSIQSLFGQPLTDGAVFVMDKKHAVTAAMLPDVDQVCSWCKLFRMDIIKENKIRYNESFIIWEDYDFFFSYMRFADNVVFVGKTLYNNVRRENRVGNIKGKKERRDIWTKKIRSRYYASKNAERNMKSVCDDAVILETLRADHVENSAYMFIIEKDPEKEKKYIKYVRKHIYSFTAFSGLKNKHFNRIRRIAKHPFAMKKFYNLRILKK